MKKLKNHPKNPNKPKGSTRPYPCQTWFTADQRKMKLGSYQPTLLSFRASLHSDLYPHRATAGLACLEMKTTSGYSIGRIDSV